MIEVLAFIGAIVLLSAVAVGLVLTVRWSLGISELFVMLDGRTKSMGVSIDSHRERLQKLEEETHPLVIGELSKRLHALFDRVEKLEASDKLTDEAFASLRNRQNAQDAAINRLERERMERVP